MSESVDALDGLIDRMAAVQREQSGRARAARHARMRAHVLERAARPATGHARTRGLSTSGARLMGIAAGVTGSLAAVAIAGVLAFRSAPLSYEVESLRDGAPTQAFLMASDGEPLLMKFSDGSTVELHARARLRVAALHEDGAVLELGAGTIEATLEPDADASWTVEAGPYRVEIAGAACVLEWDPASERIAIEVQRGQAVVRGLTMASPHEVRAGERFVRTPEARNVAADGDPSGATSHHASLKANETSDAVPGGRAREAASIRPRRHATSEVPSRSPARAASRTPITTPASTPIPPDWRTLARKNQHRDALLAAEAAGFDGILRSLDADALLDLADTARYARRPQRATQTLLALRERFPGTDAAAKAAFDLGRLEAQRATSCDTAARWFRIYVNERPGGSVVDAARRRIEDCERSHDETVPSP